jgi:hypothetical protein
MTQTNTDWTPEDDFRRYYPALGDRLARMPLMDLAQYIFEIECELQESRSK